MRVTRATAIGLGVICLAGLAACGPAPWDRPQPARVFHSHAEAQRYIAAGIGPHIRAFEQEAPERACRSESLFRARQLAENRTEDPMLRIYLGGMLLDLADIARSRNCLDEAEALYRDVALKYGGPGFETVQRRAAAGLEESRRERLRELERQREVTEPPPEPVRVTSAP